MGRRVAIKDNLFLYLIPFFIFVTIHQITTCYGDIAVISEANTTVDVFFDVELGFGSPIPYDGVVGRLVLANPEDACKGPIDPPPDSNDNSTYKWFALVKRYPCPFQTKVKHVMDAGYDGVIIYNVESMVKRNISFTHFNQFEAEGGIPAVLVAHADGISLRQNYMWDKGYFVVISPDMQFNLSAYLLPFAVVIGVCMLVMISFMVIKCFRDRRRSRRHRLSSKHLKKIPTTKFKKGDHYDTCAICLDEYVEGEKLRLLPCGHVYHMKCIDPWLTKNRRVCPVCKGKVVLPGVSDVSESESEGTHQNPSATERTPLIQPSNTRPPRRQRQRRTPRTPHTPRNIPGRARSATSPGTADSAVPSNSSSLHDSNSSRVVAAEIVPVSLPAPGHMSVNFAGDSVNSETEQDVPLPPNIGQENRLLNLATSLRRQRRSRTDAIV
ncbi:E3 ubiquitin-protein ligase RNF13 [Halotydeus destructor]|nr:E3 ubiquitin-protein ligase RNF13 [Halotydeus destructor]